VGPRTGLDNVEKRKFLPLLGLELRFLGCPARSQSLYQKSYHASYYSKFQLYNTFRLPSINSRDFNDKYQQELILFHENAKERDRGNFVKSAVTDVFLVHLCSRIGPNCNSGTLHTSEHRCVSITECCVAGNKSLFNAEAL
jgi:hypothetical protein